MTTTNNITKLNATKTSLDLIKLKNIKIIVLITSEILGIKNSINETSINKGKSVSGFTV